MRRLESKHTPIKMRKGWKVFVDNMHFKNFPRQTIENLLFSGHSPENCIELKSSLTSRVWKFKTNKRWYVIKMYLKRGALDSLKAFFVGSRARRACLNGEELIERGFNTPPMLALGEKTVAGFVTENFLITEYLPDSMGIYSLINSQFSLPLKHEDIQLKRSALRNFGRYIGALHAKGFVHGDLRLDNIIVTELNSDKVKFHLIDNERNKFFHGDIPERLRLKNLVQVNMIVLPQITFTDRLRFFKAYLEKNPELKSVSRYWIRRVFLKTKKRLQKKIPDIWQEKNAKNQDPAYH